MTGVEGFSEYEGGGVMPNTVFPKESDALTASDKLRLMSITGQEEDSRAPVDPYFWHGGVAQDPREKQRAQKEAARKTRDINRAAAARYKESRSQY